MKNEATDLLARLQRYNKQQVLDRLKQTDPMLFEHLVALLFEHRGFRTETVGKSGDEGVDVRLQKGSFSAVVQCKRYADSVGQPTVRDLYGTMMHNNADEAYLVTTAQITRQAQEWAYGKPIKFVDGHALTEWVTDHQETSASGWFGLWRIFKRRSASSTNNERTVNNMSSPSPGNYSNDTTASAQRGGLRYWFWPLVVLGILLFGVAIGIAYNRLTPRWNQDPALVESTPIVVAVAEGDDDDGGSSAEGESADDPQGKDNAGAVDPEDEEDPTATDGPTGDPATVTTATPEPTATGNADETATATEVPTEAPTATTAPLLLPTPTWTPAGEDSAGIADCSIPVDSELQQFYSASLGCPTDLTGLYWAAWQPFERGYLLWRSDTDAAYGLYGPTQGTWFRILERWDGSSSAPRGEPPSTSLVAPERGFGYVWGIRDDIFENLGWATDVEKGFCALIQPFDEGFILQSIPVDSCTEERLFNSAMSADWRPITVIAAADQQFTIR